MSSELVNKVTDMMEYIKNDDNFYGDEKDRQAYLHGMNNVLNIIINHE